MRQERSIANHLAPVQLPVNLSGRRRREEEGVSERGSEQEQENREMERERERERERKREGATDREQQCVITERKRESAE